MDFYNIIYIVYILYLLFILYIIWGIYEYFESEPTTACARYGQIMGYPICPTGTSNDAALTICYKDRWTAFGGDKEYVCTVYYDECPYNGCYINVNNNLKYGDACTSSTIPGWDDSKVGYFAYSNDYCAKGGTHEFYCQEVGDRSDIGICQVGELFEGTCWGPETCASQGLIRSEICTCTSK